MLISGCNTWFMASRKFHRPALRDSAQLDELATRQTGVDPAVLNEAAEHVAVALVRGARDEADEALIQRVIALAETEGLDTLAQVWAQAPAASLAGALWRLYTLRTWVYQSSQAAARQFAQGAAQAPVAAAISGVEHPPGPQEVLALVDAVLRGVVVGDFADTLFRASAFARVTAAGRIQAHDDDTQYADDIATSRLLSIAEELERAGKLELQGVLG